MGADRADTVGSAPAPADEPAEPDDLTVELERLREENRRLRAEYARARRASYRRAALGLAAVGAVAVAAAIPFAAQRDVLLAVGAIGLFSAVLTAYLTPERFVPAQIGELVYRQHSRTLADLAATLDLSDERRYVPLPAAANGRVRLFVPEHPDDPLPDPSTLDRPLVVPTGHGGRGLSIDPSGDAVLEELSTGGPTIRDADVATAADTAAEGLVETFELADRIQPDLAVADGRATFAVTGAVYGSPDQLDHPIPSTLACAIAQATEATVTVAVTPGDDRADWLVSCRWAAEEADRTGTSTTA